MQSNCNCSCSNDVPQMGTDQQCEFAQQMSMQTTQSIQWCSDNRCAKTFNKGRRLAQRSSHRPALSEPFVPRMKVKGQNKEHKTGRKTPKMV